ADTIPLWPEGPALESLAAFAADPSRSPELRFLAGLGLLSRGRQDLLGAVLDATCADSGESWFRPAHWQGLLDAGVPEKQLALRLAAAPPPHAYSPAVRWLLGRQRLTEEARQALAAFLDTGTGRMRELRVLAARRLHRHRDQTGFPLLLQNEFQGASP